jgi:hypothetical protein
VVAARQNGLKIAMSSPCFEYWLILHFEYTTGYMCTHQEVARRLKRHIPDYDKSSPPTEVLLSKIADAVDHAARCRPEQDKSASEIPRTDVDLLVRVMDTATRNHHRILGQASGA